MEPVTFLKFKFAILRAYKKKEITSLALKFDTKRTADFCSQHDCLRSAIAYIVKHDIDGEMLLAADVDVLKQISSDHKLAKDIIIKELKP